MRHVLVLVFTLVWGVTVCCIGQQEEQSTKTDPEKLLKALKAKQDLSDTEKALRDLLERTLEQVKQLKRQLQAAQEERKQVEKKASEAAAGLRRFDLLLTKKIGTLQRVIKQLLIYGEGLHDHKPSLGIRTKSLHEETRKALGLDGEIGVKVTFANDWAKNQGIRVGDIIVEIDGRKVEWDSVKQRFTPHPEDLRMLPGDKVNLVIIRKGQRKVITFKLACKKCGSPQKCPLSAGGELAVREQFPCSLEVIDFWVNPSWYKNIVDPAESVAPDVIVCLRSVKSGLLWSNKWRDTWAAKIGRLVARIYNTDTLIIEMEDEDPFSENEKIGYVTVDVNKLLGKGPVRVPVATYKGKTVAYITLKVTRK